MDGKKTIKITLRVNRLFIERAQKHLNQIAEKTGYMPCFSEYMRVAGYVCHKNKKLNNLFVKYLVAYFKDRI